MYLNPQDKQRNFTVFSFLSGVVCQAKEETTPTQNPQDKTWTIELSESNSFSLDFAFSCFGKLECLGYCYSDEKVPGGIIEWVDNGILCTLSWLSLDNASRMKIIYSEDSENPEAIEFFRI